MAKQAAARIQTSVTPQCFIHASVYAKFIPILIKAELWRATIFQISTHTALSSLKGTLYATCWASVFTGLA